jgi:beta-aspartyl-peptidase (threonine type)
MILLGSSEGESGYGPAVPILEAGGSALDALEAAVRAAEVSGSTSVGMSGIPNMLGRMELDAGFMDGRTRKSGAVAALQGCVHPVSIARKVMEKLSHELLAGRGAALFAHEMGLLDGIEALTGDVGNLAPHLGKELWKRVASPENHDTVVYLCQDKAGDIAVATSTSGFGGKYFGRVGDTPIVGAGFYAENGAGACACTGAGEMTIRCGTARMVVAALKAGAPVDYAVQYCVEDLASLKTGRIDGVTVHAIDAKGGYAVGALNSKGSSYYLWTEGTSGPTRQQAALISR